MREGKREEDEGSTGRVDQMRCGKKKQTWQAKRREIGLIYAVCVFLGSNHVCFLIQLVGLRLR